MSRLPRRRVGTRVEYEQQEVSFSAWPLARGTSRIEFQKVLFTSNLWDVMRAAANLRCPPARLSEAEALITMAEDLYRAAVSAIRANPLLLYLVFQNLAKALIVVSGHTGSLENLIDGITDQHGLDGWELRNAWILVEPSAGPNVFQLLAAALRLPVPAPGSAIPVLDLLPQVVVGHRLYRSATAAPEHFAAAQELQFMHDVVERTVWIDLLFDSGRLGRADLTTSKLIGAGALGAAFRQVESDLAGRRRFEMLKPFSYDKHPSERLQEVVDAVRPYLWTAVSKASPYRVHHVCLATANRVPQVLGLYLLHFAFGSIMRIRPHRFDELLAEPIGTFVVDFISRQPEQLLHLLASEFAEREVVQGSESLSGQPRTRGRRSFQERAVKLWSRPAYR
jgi:YaaC-like Protein